VRGGWKGGVYRSGGGSRKERAGGTMAKVRGVGGGEGGQREGRKGIGQEKEVAENEGGSEKRGKGGKKARWVRGA